VARTDFDGDGRSDILWSTSKGQLSSWVATAEGDFAVSPAFAFNSDFMGRSVLGLGDFNLDGRADIVSNAGGLGVTVSLATADGGFLVSNNSLGFAAPGWVGTDVADFNGDGRVDILWRTFYGRISIWLATENGGFAPINMQLPADFNIAGVGDFNGDGRDDILWRGYDNNLVGTWLASPTGEFAFNNSVVAGSVAGWLSGGVGDFNGDGRDDMLWTTASRHVSIWLATQEGKFIVDNASGINQAAFGWRLEGIGDYNGDGRDDALWRHESGPLSLWLENANGVFTVDSVAAHASIDWYVVSD
jgi:hypothetical protein